MLSTLIASKTRVKLLTLFLTHPDERFYYTELFKRLKVSHSALQKELKKLEEGGLLESKREANVRYYWVNKKFPIFEELKTIVLKTVGLAEELKADLDHIGNLELSQPKLPRKK